MDYLISAVEHLDSSPTARDLKYAVLHLQAATEVLFKARLIVQDWRLLSKKPAEADTGAFDRGDFQIGDVTLVATYRQLARWTEKCKINRVRHVRYAAVR
ncbi:hypothetical protein ACIRJ3_30560 [Streptomyces anulatus]